MHTSKMSKHLSAGLLVIAFASGGCGSGKNRNLSAPPAPELRTPQALAANGWFRATPNPGGTGLKIEFDPAGQGHYLPGAAELAPYGGQPGAQFTVSGPTVPAGIAGETPALLSKANKISVTGAKFTVRGADTGGNRAPFNLWEQLWTVESLGQSFTVPPDGGWLDSVTFMLARDRGKPSAVTVRLLRDGPGGEQLAIRECDVPKTSEPTALPLPQPVPPGTFYLEVRARAGTPYWFCCKTDVFPGGTEFVNGKPEPGRDLCFEYTVANIGTMDWSAILDGATLRCEMAVREQAVNLPLSHAKLDQRPALALTFPWQRDGYETADPAVAPFRFLVTDGGWYYPVHAFKRRSQDRLLEPDGNTFRLGGANGYDLEIAPARGRVEPRMDADRFHFLLDHDASIKPLPADPQAALAEFPRFFTSDPQVDPVLNEFLLTFLTNHSATPVSYEWDSIKLAWTGSKSLESFKRVHIHYTYRVDPDGYIWCRGDTRGWNGGDCSESDNRLYDSNLHFISSAWRVYAWTGDREFLAKEMPAVRAATGFLLDKLGATKNGIITLPGIDKAGLPDKSAACNYMDCLPSGYQDAYLNAFLAPALEAAAALEDVAGDTARANDLRKVAAHARAEFNRLFWNDKAGRYIDWIDSNGKRYDYGATYINTIAATHGYASQDQVKRMFNWMTTELTPSGKPDTFSRWIIAPRTHTQRCTAMSDRTGFPYDEWCEDGGAILWTAYYEIMARARFLGADDAWGRFREILGRFAEPDHLVGGNPYCRGEVDNHLAVGSVGVGLEFPESGIAPCAFLYAFLGVEIQPDGIRIRPNLPTALEYAGVDGLVYRGVRLKLTCWRDRVLIECAGSKQELPLGPDGAVILKKETLIPKQ